MRDQGRSLNARAHPHGLPDRYGSELRDVPDDRSPSLGDYNYVSAVGSTVRAVWTDTRDLVPGSDPRGTGADDDADGLDGFQTCIWVPNDIDAPAYESPTIADACLSQGALDQNIYIAP